MRIYAYCQPAFSGYRQRKFVSAQDAVLLQGRGSWQYNETRKSSLLILKHRSVTGSLATQMSAKGLYSVGATSEIYI
jgi:hypothetical protein